MGCKEVAAKPPKLEIKPCPNCGNQAAVEYWQAHFAYHSKHYTRLRNAARNSPVRKVPQVGRIGTVEQIMLDDGFAEHLKTIRTENPLTASFRSDEFLWKVIPWMIGAVVVALVFLGIDSTLVELTVLSVVTIMLWIESRLDSSFIKQYLASHRSSEVQWLCVNCKHHWMEKSERPK